MTTWPNTLPTALLVEGYTEQPQDNAIRYQTEVGPAKMRRRGTAAGRVIQGGLVLTQTQRQTFDEFFETTLSHGTASFTWKDPGKGPGTFAFNAPPQYSLVAPGTWRVSVQLLRHA